MKHFTVRCRRSVLGSSLTPEERRVWRNGWQVLNGLLSQQPDGKGAGVRFCEGPGGWFQVLKCCCVLLLGVLCVAFGGKPRSGRQEFLGGKAPLYFGELVIVAGADWKQSRATMPGGGAQTCLGPLSELPDS